MVFTEGMHTGEAIAEMAMGPSYHNDAGTVLSGQNLAAGAAVGSIVGGTSASAAKSGGNTGNGTFVLDATTPIQPRAKEGVYTLRCITAVTNGGVFRLEDPDGIVLGDFTIPAGAGNSVTISEHIKGALTDGSTDFAVGDGFDITISGLTEKLVEYNPSGTDGSQIMKGLLYAAVNATSGDKPGVVTARGPALAVAANITWKSGMTTAQKTTGIARLLARGIKAL